MEPLSPDGVATVLVIDDEEPFCRSLARVLTTSRCSVLWALDGKTGIEMAAGDRPHLIVLDISMPGMDGIETFRRLSEMPATGDIPVIMMTASDDGETLMRAIRRRPDQLLMKPVDPDYLRKVTNRWLTLSRQNHPRNDPATASDANADGKGSPERVQNRLHANRMELLGRLAAGVAHDFNNLLTVIVGHAELCAEQTSAAPELVESMKAILGAGGRARRLTRHILARSRVESFTPETICLNESVAESLTMYRSLLGKDIGINFTPGSGSLLIEADSGQIDQIIANLLVNARDAIDAGGPKADRWIRIDTGLRRIDDAHSAARHGLTPGPWATLSVSDSGVGMEADTQKRIFEPFFTTKARDKGTGMGLPIVCGILKQNGGHIAVHSEPGKGATFTVCWPPSQVCRAAESRVRAVPPPAS